MMKVNSKKKAVILRSSSHDNQDEDDVLKCNFILVDGLNQVILYHLMA